MDNKNQDLSNIREYYGGVLGGTDDLRTGACCQGLFPCGPADGSEAAPCDDGGSCGC